MHVYVITSCFAKKIVSKYVRRKCVENWKIVRTSGKEHPMNNMYTKIINKVICFLSFHIATYPGLSKSSFEQPGPGYDLSVDTEWFSYNHFDCLDRPSHP